MQRTSIAAWIAALAAQEQGRLILFLPVSMAGGIAAYFAWPSEPWALPPAALAAACFLSAACLRRRRVRGIFLCAGFAAGGFASAAMETLRMPGWVPLPRHAVAIQGMVERVDVLPDGRRVTVASPRLDGGPAMRRALRIRLHARDDTALPVGSTVQMRALVRPPAPPGYPGAWDTQRDAFYSGLGGYGFALANAVSAGEPGASSWVVLRARIADRIMSTLPGPRGAIAATLLTGISTTIPPPDRVAFQDSGLAHLLAVAGLHSGIVMGLVYAGIRRGLSLSEHAALRWPLKQIAAIGALAAGFLYLILTGAHVPILRNFAMACLVTLAVLTGRRALSLRSLALAAIVLMALSPDLVMGVSFQMSFAAVMALIAGWEALSPILAALHGPGWWRPPVHHAAALAATSVLAGTASLPIAAYHFGTAAPYYVPANLAAVPLTAFWIMPWGLGALLLMPLGLQGIALVPMGWGISAVIAIAHGVAAWPQAHIPLPQPPAGALLLFMAGLCCLCLLRSHLRFTGIAVMAAGLCTAWLAPMPDLLIGQDGRLIAVRSDGGIFVSADKGTSRMERDAPLRLWGAARAGTLPPAAQVQPGSLRCSAQACGITRSGQTAYILTSAAAPCPAATVVVSHRHVTCAGSLTIDSVTTRQRGALTLRLTPRGPVVNGANDGRAGRPWSIPNSAGPDSAGTEPSRLPAAMTE